MNVWSEKTTVCRIFSCQRSLRGKYRPAESFGIAGRFPPRPPSLPAIAIRSPPENFKDRNLRQVRMNRAASSELGFSGVPSEPARPQWPRFKFGGEYRARTGDLLVANQALSQLS